jgi:hypothetical protein
MQDQTSANFEAFSRLLPDLLEQHRGYHALIHSGEIVGYYSSSIAAIKAGYKEFGEGCFSVELVDDVPEDLGFFSHVSAALHA